MDIQVIFKKDAVVVSPNGNMDTNAAQELDHVFRKLIKDGHVKLVADLEEMNYTSSAGLRAIISAVKQTRQRDGDLGLAGVQPEVNKVLDFAGFTSVLKTYDDMDSAVASFE